MNCFGCGAENTVDGRVGRGDMCARCGRPLHCCRNCGFYDPNRHNKCKEPQAEWVADREAANFCEYFSPLTGGKSSSGDKSAEARRKLDELFG